VIKSFHFDLGNSNDGQVGACARVRASSKKEALEILLSHLGDEGEVEVIDEFTSDGDDDKGIEYFNVYLNYDLITTKDIDEVNEVYE
jgi:hypothetical protein